MNIRIFRITAIFLGLTAVVNAQIKIQADTSYTVYSAYKKYVKKYPGIHIVKPSIYKNVIEIKNRVYSRIDDRQLQLDAFIEKSEDMKPAILLIHGGGWKSGNRSHMIPMAQSLASKGYACFAVEYRLAPEAKFPAAVFDIKNAVKYIKLHAPEFKVDTARVVVLGCSSGGQLAALVGTTNGNENFEDSSNTANENAVVQAIIDIDGILAFKHPESEEGASAAFWLGGTCEAVPEVWKQASALAHVDEKTPPVLFINSNFRRFHAGRDDMIEVLKKNGTYFEICEFEDAPHTFWLFDRWFEPTINCITNFLNKTFNNKKSFR